MVAPCKFDVLTTVFVDKQNTRGLVIDRSDQNPPIAATSVTF